MRKGKKQVQEFSVEQEVVRTDVKGESFDLLLRFNNSVDQPELFMDELVKLILEGLLERYGQIVVKVNWWSPGLMVISPNGIPDPNPTGNALQGHSEAPSGTIELDLSPNTTLEK